MRFRQRNTEFGDLERRLRDERTAPSEGLRQSVFQLTSRVGARRRHAALRLGLALAVTAVTIVAAAALGSASYAGDGGNNKKNEGQENGQRGDREDSSDSQYGEKVIICYRVGKLRGVTLRLPRVAAKILLHEFPRSTLGPC